MGKNTMMKRCIRLYCERTKDDSWAALLNHLVGNVGVVFSKRDLNEIRDEIEKHKVGAPARVGAIAPNDVTVPAGPTSMDPSQTSFFQALNIATKINKGSIEITTDVPLIKGGEKVGGSAATLLSKLGIKPFKYGLIPVMVYDSGSVYEPKVLDITDEDMEEGVKAAIANITALSLGTGYPTLPALPHVISNAYKNVLAIALETDYVFPRAEKIKEMLENPEAFMAAVAAAAPADSGPAAAAETKEEAKVEEEEEEESDSDMGMDLFG